MTDRDIDELFRRFADLDRELKELRTEVNQLKWYQQHGTNGAVAYSANSAKWVPQWEENLEPTKPAQWPNEPYTDYLKRIGEYNEALIYEDDGK